MPRRHPLTNCPDQQTGDDAGAERSQLLLRGTAGARYRVSATDSVENRETTQPMSSSEEEVLSERLTEVHAWHISGDIGDLWRQLAREQLGFTNGNCDGFNYDYQLHGQREIVYQMLRGYIRQDESHPPTVGDLCDALENVGLRQVAEKLLAFARNGQIPSS
ncbi:receptor-interacting serine/threonine-protein kinase 1-like [Branchiostoma lanceolatum]|uniref:receptor-interacting serine/threonine-protein kinase 1-like n=1 Tax=Branchiostoma lanceolatum TaxID=7740 RepID=UPI00345221CF